MEHEGMVHALEEIHRLLKPGGRLIDIHPLVEPAMLTVIQGERVLFAEPRLGHGDGDVRQAEGALAQAIQRGLFMLERAGEFDFLTYAASVAELRDFLEEAAAFDETPWDEEVLAQDAELYARVEAALQAAGAGAEVALSERVRIARLKPLR